MVNPSSSLPAGSPPALGRTKKDSPKLPAGSPPTLNGAEKKAQPSKLPASSSVETTAQEAQRNGEMDDFLGKINRAVINGKSVVFIAPRLETHKEHTILELGLSTWAWGTVGKVEHWTVTGNEGKKSRRAARNPGQPPVEFAYGASKKLTTQAAVGRLLTRRLADAGEAYDMVILLGHGVSYPLTTLKNALGWSLPSGVRVLDTRDVARVRDCSLGYAMSLAGLPGLRGKVGNAGNEAWIIQFLVQNLLRFQYYDELKLQRQKEQKPQSAPKAATTVTEAAHGQKKPAARQPPRHYRRPAGTLKQVDRGVVPVKGDDGWMKMERKFVVRRRLSN